jgi:hypothetical protein
MKRVVLIMAAVGIGFPSYALAQDDTRTITPVDANGNPIGPPQTIYVPEHPTGSATGIMVDQYGNATSEPFQVPDQVQPPEAPPPPNPPPESYAPLDDGLVPETQMPPPDYSGSDEGSPNDSGSDEGSPNE